MRVNEIINESETGKNSKSVKYKGLILKYAFNDRALVIKVYEPITKNPLGYVKFVKENVELYPQDLWVNDDYRNRGIAKSMYDYLKSEGYVINRSHDQTKAGSGFWDKHRGEDVYVWEEGYQPPELEIGDKILKGKFKNSPAEIKGFKKDKHNQPVLKTDKGDVQLFKPRIAKLDEIDFSSGLGDLSLSPEQIINKSSDDGTIGSRKVYLFKADANKIYFFMDRQKIDALVYLFGDRIMAMKNFSSNRGLMYNLFQYIINIKGQRVRLTPEDKLTGDGIKWIIDQLNRQNGFKITDGDGNKIDASALYQEWENARITGNSGSTEIVIGESKNCKQLRENESRLMPMDIFGSTLKDSGDQSIDRLEMINILETKQLF